MTSPWIDAVRSSHDRFAALTGSLSHDEVTGPSYASDWTVAQVASHLGSQAEIFELFLAAGLAGDPSPGGDAFGPIWDRWNALEPILQVRRSTEANESFVTRVEHIPTEQAGKFALSVFGTDLDLDGLLAMRLSEHAVHAWDVEVALDPTAVVAADAVELLVDLLPERVGRVGKPTEDVGALVVETSGPDRRWLLTTHPAVTLEPVPDGSDTSEQPLRLPAEAFLRLVNGRLDDDHTPDEVHDERLPALRRVFPGF
jgi:uncharacterized protein (TIGR03083 family)